MNQVKMIREIVAVFKNLRKNSREEKPKRTRGAFGTWKPRYALGPKRAVRVTMRQRSLMLAGA